MDTHSDQFFLTETFPRRTEMVAALPSTANQGHSELTSVFSRFLFYHTVVFKFVCSADVGNPFEYIACLRRKGVSFAASLALAMHRETQSKLKIFWNNKLIPRVLCILLLFRHTRIIFWLIQPDIYKNKRPLRPHVMSLFSSCHYLFTVPSIPSTPHLTFSPTPRATTCYNTPQNSSLFSSHIPLYTLTSPLLMPQTPSPSHHAFQYSALSVRLWGLPSFSLLSYGLSIL